MATDALSNEAKRVVRALWAQYSVNFRDRAVAQELIASTCVDHDPLGEWVGPESAVQWFAPLRTLFPDIMEGFPDIHSTFDALVADGDKVIVRGSERGTYRNLFRGHPPSGLPVKVTVINIFRVADGHVVERWAAFNLTPFLKALNMLMPSS